MNSFEIRDTLTQLDTILTEASRGLLYRKPGDTFIQGDPKNPSAKMVFRTVTYFPSQPGEYKDSIALSKAIEKAEINFPGLQYSNKATGSSKGFAILTLDGPLAGQETFVCRFFQKIMPDMTGKWKNDELPGGWQLAKSTSLKASYGLKPADLLSTNVMFNNPIAILNELSNKPKVAALIPGMEQLLANQLPVFNGQKDMLSAIQDDLGEIMAPIALAKGLITDNGAQAARDALLDGADWSGCQISFPAGKNNGLVDSYVYVNGIEVGISSKGDKGATASIKNVADGIDIARKDNTPEHKKALTNFSKQIAVVDKIKNTPALDFPIVYAVEHEIISSRVGEKIKELISLGAKTLNKIKLTAGDRNVLEYYASMINAKTNLPNYCIGYHILSAVAREVSEDINGDPKFGKACLYFVNVNPIMQIYMKAAVSGEDVKVTGFKSLYPPNFQGTILVDSSKNFTATGVGGKLNFAYSPDKNAATNKADASANAVANKLAAADTITAQKIDKLKKGMSSLRPPGTKTTSREKKASAPRQRR